MKLVKRSKPCPGPELNVHSGFPLVSDDEDDEDDEHAVPYCFL